MPTTIRAITTATLTLMLAAGLVVQMAIAQPAYAVVPEVPVAVDIVDPADADVDGTGDADGVGEPTAEPEGGNDTDGDAGTDPAPQEPTALDPGQVPDPEPVPEPVADPPLVEVPEPAAEPELVPLEPETMPAEVGPSAIDLRILTEKIEKEPMVAAAQGASAVQILKRFQPGNLISDKNFYDKNAMNAAQIQTFLNKMMPRCTIGTPGRAAGTPIFGSAIATDCLNTAVFSGSLNPSKAANAYCSAYTGGTSDSSATVINKVAKACGISPRVLLVMLDKEQSLVTDTWPTVRQYDFAMGAYCPDDGPGNSANCNSTRKGFVNQVYESARLFQYYKSQNGLNFTPYKTNNILYNPNRACGSSPVYIENMATASLYSYTPYQPNSASLAAGLSGSANACATYGNRNFFVFYSQWFGSPTSFFPDVTAGHQFFKEIEWMGTSGLSTGVKTSDGRAPVYQPKSKVTREAMAAFLYRLEGSNYKGPAKSPFTDVKKGDKFYNEIAWMYKEGLSTGIKQANGTRIYAPKDRVSREAMAAFIYRLNKANYTAPAKSPFVDMKKGDKFYREIAWMYKEGLSTGIKQANGSKKYEPKDRVSREAMAAFIYRLNH